MSVEKFNYKISLLEMVGEMYAGIGLVLIVKDGDKTYEALLWVSPNTEKIADKFIMPTEFLEEKGLTSLKEHPKYDEFLKCAWKVLPKRDIVLKEGFNME